MSLEVRGLDVHYGQSHAVRDLSIEVPPGEITALLGRNGAGKTTTLKAITGILRATRGEILLDGEDIGSAAPHVRARKGIGYVPQGRLVFQNLTVAENLAAVRADRQVSTDWIMEMFPILAERSAQKAGTLSGGEQQMLAIARALMVRPKYLLLDEPSTGLMPRILIPLKEALRRLQSEGMGILLVEEKVPLALELATRGYVIDTGRLVHAGDAASLRDRDLLVRHLGVGAHREEAD
ncbi:MAG: ABC transporter ATP-binding protein [Actinomycetes bacterium]